MFLPRSFITKKASKLGCGCFATSPRFDTIRRFEDESRMQIIPAIDLRAGRCVRLRQGNYDDETVFGDDPAAMAKHWVSQGAERLHLVDLDGAREGHPANVASVRA